MKNSILIIGFLLLHLSSFAQVNELEKIRKELTLFVSYDNDKVDSLPKSAATTLRLKHNLENAFLAFVLHKDSKDLEGLKKNSIDNKTDYIIGNHNYFFGNQRRNVFLKTLDNNVNYCITFYGVYDYQLSNFVSIYIQPFTVGAKEYIVYYYKLNGAGVYYIKDAATNSIVFKSEAFTSNAAILQFHQIDGKHLLLVEDMGYKGQRAIVVNSEPATWQAIHAFNGTSFPENATDYTQKMGKGKHTYFRFAESKTVISLYGPGFLKKYEIQFDEGSKMISYKRYNKNESGIKTIQAKWENNMFNIDDYYIGQDLEDKDLPIPR